MGKTRSLLWAMIGVGLLAGATGCTPFFLGGAPVPIPVPPWVSEQMEEKYADRFKERTPVMPPILPGSPPVLCVDPPSEEEIIMALPRVLRGIPFVLEETRDDFTVVTELLVDQIDPCTFVPLLGPAQLHHCHYKCTVWFKQKFTSCQPFPFMVENDRVEVIYIDKDHFHLCVGGDAKKQREISRDVRGPNYD